MQPQYIATVSNITQARAAINGLYRVCGLEIEAESTPEWEYNLYTKQAIPQTDAILAAEFISGVVCAVDYIRAN